MNESPSAPAAPAADGTASQLGPRFRVGEWLAEPGLHELRRAGHSRHLEPKVMELLVYLACRSERTVTRQELLDALWRGRFVGEGVLTRSVFALRQALEDDPQEPRYIQTVPKLGYRLVATVAAPIHPAKPAGTAAAGRRIPTGLAGAGGPGRRQGAATALAVLPFRDLDPDAGNDHLAIGLADAIIAELAQVRPLIVRPTSAILAYQPRAVSPRQAGSELAVDAILDGTFQRSGSRLRVTVQLVSTADGCSLWGDKIDTSLDDLFRMQDEVSRNIARTLGSWLAGDAERGRPAPGPAGGGEATAGDTAAGGSTPPRAHPAGAVYELCLKGRLHLFRDTLDEFMAGVDCFDRAVTADPLCALAWAGLADAYSRIGFTYLPEGEWYARAWAACERALALDPELPEARYVRGGRLLWSPQAGFDHAGALRDLVPAIAARPSLEEAHVRLGAILHHVGLIDEVERELERALVVSPEHVVARQHQGLCCYTRGNYEQALAIYQAIERRSPASWVHYQVALCELRLDRLDGAAATVDHMERQVPGEILAYPVRGLIAARRGDEGEARRQVLMTVRHQRSFGHYHHAQYDLACIHALLGAAGEAIGWLAAAARNGFPCVPQFESDPFLAALAGESRFVELLDELRRERDAYARLYAELRAASG
jgi:TolB-like protein/tetratricopeptide (TPR) repeat protein